MRGAAGHVGSCVECSRIPCGLSLPKSLLFVVATLRSPVPQPSATSNRWFQKSPQTTMPPTPWYLRFLTKAKYTSECLSHCLRKSMRRLSMMLRIGAPNWEARRGASMRRRGPRSCPGCVSRKLNCFTGISSTRAACIMPERRWTLDDATARTSSAVRWRLSPACLRMCAGLPGFVYRAGLSGERAGEAATASKARGLALAPQRACSIQGGRRAGRHCGRRRRIRMGPHADRGGTGALGLLGLGARNLGRGLRVEFLVRAPLATGRQVKPSTRRAPRRSRAAAELRPSPNVRRRLRACRHL